MWWIMEFDDVVDVIREKLLQHRISGKATLWSTIVTRIASNDSFDAKYADTILEAIRSLLESLDDRTVISLWRQSETGMGDDTEDDCLFPDCCRMQLEMELLQTITDLAWAEAKQK
jgi:hypothetical protein